MQNTTTMAGQSSEFPGNTSDSVTKISQVITDRDQKLMETEAYTKYMKLEIAKLERKPETFKAKSQKLKAETEGIRKDIKELDLSIDISRKSLEIKSSMCVNLQQEITRKEAEIQNNAILNEKTYNEYLEKYKKARNVYEIYHPLYNEAKELKIKNLKNEVQFKMFQAQIVMKKRQIKQHREIQTKMYNAKIVKFVKYTLGYWKTRDLTNQLAAAEREEARLTEELNNLSIRTAQKDKELRPLTPTPVSNKPTTVIQNIEFMADNDDDNYFAIPSVAPLPACSTSFNPLVARNRPTREEIKHQIRARCEQRQQQWKKEHSFSKQLPVNKDLQIPGQATNLQAQKRPLQPSNFRQSSQLKIPKTSPDYNVVRKENYPFINQQVIQNATTISAGNENLALRPKNPKANIISVQTFNSVPINQHSYERPVAQDNINKNYSQVIPPHSLPKPLPYPSENAISPRQSQEVISTTINVVKQQNSQILSGSTINPYATQNPSPYSSQTPLQYRSEMAASQPQPSIGLQLTQEMTQIKSGIVNPYSMTQTNITQASNKSGDNTIGTTQSSTFSQKYMELQHFLDTELQDTSFVPSLPPQNPSVELAVTSPFFNKPKPGETTEIATKPHESVPLQQEPLTGNENVANIQEYLDNSGLYYGDDEVDPSISFDCPVLSPDYQENNLSAAEPQPQSTGFSFNFAQPQTTQAAETKFTFSNANPSTNFFNMF